MPCTIGRVPGDCREHDGNRAQFVDQPARQGSRQARGFLRSA
jgi:hypothetical protein